ncbi:TIR domain-containing protein [Dongia sp.]|uniref:TIR domain-containing protein n=1 Tax=Dongia sp. TaxID=1977262 RepID=UPI0035B136D9
MANRFDGPDSREVLIDALRGQEVIEHDGALAAAIADIATIESLSAGKNLIKQDEDNNDLFFILQGTANIYVNNRLVASRGPGTCVGEMSLIDAASPRAATVRAMTKMVVAKLTENQFRQVGQAFPSIWRAFARVLADRLRQRSVFHRPPNPEPVLFLGCSAEELPLANAIRDALAGDKIDVRVWNNGIFGPSSITLDTLLAATKDSDFAALIFGADDWVISRGRKLPAPRDNVIFELGLFMGQLDRERAFVISGSKNIKVPSDLLGLTHIRSGAVGTKQIGMAAKEISADLRKAILKLGVR